MTPAPRTPARLVLLGAGHAHLEVLRRFALAPPAGAAVTLVSRRPAALYSGMLPGVVAGHYRAEEAAIPLAPLAERAGAALVVAEAVGLDPVARRVALAGGGSVGYDLLSLDVGGVAAPVEGLPDGAAVLPLRPVEDFAAAWERAAAALAPGEAVAVAGGGAAGVEIALALAWRAVRERRRLRLALVERGPRILPGMPAAARRAALAAAARRGVEVREGAEGGEGAALVVWATGSAAPGWVAGAGIATDAAGFVAVGPTLASLSHPEVFAAGDVASLADAPGAKSGVVAVRQGPVLAANLRRALAGQPGRTFRPPRRWLSLIATGPRHAIATRDGIAVSGRWVWTWKDRIDRGFVARYRDGVRRPCRERSP